MSRPLLAVLLIGCTAQMGDIDDEPPPPDAGPPPYSSVLFDKKRINSKPDQPDYQRVTAAFDLHDGPFADVKLTFDLGTTCFPFESWQTNPPPQGQNWPADCDAFDRLFQITLDPRRPDDQPGFEIMRAATPFGGPAQIVLDVTDLANTLAPGQHEVEVYITTQSDPNGLVSGSNGGWTISGRLDATPGTPPRAVLAAVSLVKRFDTATGQAPITLSLPDATTRAVIEYRATGHGAATPDAGCIGGADEFCRRTHTLFIDEASAVTFDAWNPSCAHMCDRTQTTYCKQNPTGNIQSVRAPRANWCPGEVTAPRILETTWTAGTHTFRYDINRIAMGGRWAISAIAYAYAN